MARSKGITTLRDIERLTTVQLLAFYAAITAMPPGSSDRTLAAAVEAIAALRGTQLEVRSLQAYYG